MKLKKIWDFLCSPFTHNLPLFCVLFILASLTDLIAWIMYGDPMFAFYFALHGYVMCYVIVLWAYMFRSVLWYKRFFISLGIINAAIDVFCHYTLHMGFTYDMVGIVKATNLSEAREFADMFFDYKPLLLLILMCACCFVLYKFMRKIKLTPFLQIIALLIVCLGLSVSIMKKSTNWGRVFLGKPYLYLTYKLPPDLNQYFSDIEIEYDKECLPRNIVLIIGESFSKSHSSLYGYDKNTNPRLIGLQEDNFLYVCDSVIAPATHTIPCFQSIMSTYSSDAVDASKEWYECTTIIEVMSKLDYRTTWVSNQSQKGGYDNVVAKYAELCDTSLWAGNRYEGTNRTSYDEEILPLLSSVIDTLNTRNFYCVHLMGSHYTFDTRYPSEMWTFFKMEDYQNAEPHQRYDLASYDNSILYNDYVVREVIRFFENDESLIIYLSDHALDIYQSSDDYVGHATGNPISQSVALQIPYMIYLSEKCKTKHPNMIEYSEQSIRRPFNSADLIFEILNLIGVKMNS